MEDLERLATRAPDQALAAVARRARDLAHTDVFAAVPDQEREHTLAHGDLHAGNMVETHEGRVWLIDFDLSGYWPTGWDLASVHATWVTRRALLAHPYPVEELWTALLSDPRLRPPAAALTVSRQLAVMAAFLRELPRHSATRGTHQTDPATLAPRAISQLRDLAAQLE